MATRIRKLVIDLRNPKRSIAAKIDIVSTRAESVGDLSSSLRDNSGNVVKDTITAEPEGPQLSNDSKGGISAIITVNTVKSKIILKNNSSVDLWLNFPFLLINTFDYRLKPKLKYIKYIKREHKNQNGSQKPWIQGRIVTNSYKTSNVLYKCDFKKYQIRMKTKPLKIP